MSKILKIIIICGLMASLIGCGGNKAKTPKRLGDYVGTDVATAVSELEQAGFTNINVNGLDNLSSAEAILDNAIVSISIDGKSDIKKGKKFANDSEVAISYNSLKRIEKPNGAEYEGKKYYEVVNKLNSLGFTNIEYNNIEDLTSDNPQNDELVVDVDFECAKELVVDSTIPYDSKIIVTYHSIKRIEYPFSDVNNIRSEEVVEKLTRLGFVNVTFEEFYDLDEDDESVVKNYVSNDMGELKQGEQVTFDSYIKVESHYPKPKYKTLIKVSVSPNLLFDKYDVAMEFEGDSERIKHGDNAEFEYDLREGHYKITFSPVGESGDYIQEFDVPADLEVDISLSCTGKGIVGRGKYINAVVVPNVSGCDYYDAKSYLNSLGFSDIKCVDSSTSEEKYGGDYVVLNQNIPSGQAVSMKEPIRLECEAKSSYVQRYWNLDVNQSFNEASKLCNAIESYDYITKVNIDDKIKNMSSDEKNLWIVKMSEVKERNIVKLYYVFKGSVEMPDLTGIKLDIAISKMKDLGFSGVDYVAADGSRVGSESNWVVKKQSVEANKKVNANGKITLTVEKYVEPTKASTATANKDKKRDTGDKGVYAYTQSGKFYDQYYIIDFDDGYVYYFLDWKDETENNCEKIKIVSGNLNDYVLITFHDGDDEWSYGLHFKYKYHPERLIVQDDDGAEYEYWETSVDRAKRLMRGRNMREL